MYHTNIIKQQGCATIEQAVIQKQTVKLTLAGP